MTVANDALRQIGAPDQLETSLGSLKFVDGVPSADSAQRLYDHLDFVHGVNVYLDGFAAASTYAIRKGFHAAGAEDNSIIIFSELMGSESVFLTANADTVYYVGVVDLSHGPMVVETPPQALGVFDDMWWGWIIDFGLPGPDRGEGGRFLLVPPDYDGPLPDSGYHIGHSKTSRALLLGRSFLANDDPAPTVDTIKRTLKLYPYAPGSGGTSVATLLQGGALPAAPVAIPETVFIEGSGNAFNTVPPSDYGFFELMNEAVQDEPAGSTNPELLGQLAAIGIVKGRPFEPDARLRRILDDAAAVGHATSRALFFDFRESEGFHFYDSDSAWFNMLWVGGYTFETPPPLVTKDGIEPFPATGARTLHSRTAFLYAATGVSPAMCMRITGLGSQYLMAVRDSGGSPFDGSRTYRVTLPANIPAARFWSFTLYDNETRSMLQTPQRYPRAGSQSFPTPAATPNADGTTTVTFGPERPPDVPEGNWIQTTAGKGWFPILRLYSPLEPFFDHSWRAGEIEAID